MKIITKFALITALALVMVLAVAGVAMATATVSTYDSLTYLPKVDFAPEETVLIQGSGFPANIPILVKVTRPDGSVVKGDGLFEEGSDIVLTDEIGNLSYPYILDGVIGEYTVDCYDGAVVLASCVFTDGPHQLFGVDKGSTNWTPGIIGGYSEGDSVSFKLRIKVEQRNLPFTEALTVKLESEYEGTHGFASTTGVFYVGDADGNPLDPDVASWTSGSETNTGGYVRHSGTFTATTAVSGGYYYLYFQGVLADDSHQWGRSDNIKTTVEFPSGSKTVPCETPSPGEPDVDNVAPTGSVEINSGAAYTKTTAVSLGLTAIDNPGGSGVASMMVSYFGDFSDNPSWELYLTSKAWTLTAGDGTNTVYVKYKDLAGNESDPVSIDTIVLDTIAPTIANTTGDIAQAFGTDVVITTDVTDSGSGVDHVVLHYQKPGQGGWVKDLTMTNIGGNTYQGTIPAADFSAALEYDIYAYDVAVNMTVDGYYDVAEVVTPTNQAPTADAGAEKSGLVGEVISFDSSGSSDIDGTIVSYLWNFGDGGTSTDANPTHTYLAAGSYIVTLTVTDDDSATGTDTVGGIAGDPSQTPGVTISIIPNAVPTADAGDAVVGAIGTPVSFDGSGSSDSDGTIVSYDWDWGDGTAHGSGVSPTHTYTVAGSYVVTLTVMDDDDATGTDTVGGIAGDPNTTPGVTITAVTDNPPSTYITSPAVGWTNATIQQYTVDRGFGWWPDISGMDDRDRGTGEYVAADFIFCTTDKEFRADLANGDYTVIVYLGDESYYHDNIDISAEGTLKLDNVSTKAKEYVARSFAVSVSDGQLNIKFHDDGGTDPNWVINGIEIVAPGSVKAYDFGPAKTTPSGWTSVATPAYSSAAGFGWDSTLPGYPNLFARDRVTGQLVESDFVGSNSDNVFKVDLPAGVETVNVTVWMGDKTYAHDKMDVYAENSLMLNDVITNVAEYYTSTFSVAVTDGQLNLRFHDDGGTDPNWVLNAVQVTWGRTVAFDFVDDDAATVTRPAGSNVISGLTSIKAAASDDFGVNMVDFYYYSASTPDPIGNPSGWSSEYHLIASDATSPYSADWNTAAVADGGYKLITVAYDTISQYSISAARVVTVANGTSAARAFDMDDDDEGIWTSAGYTSVLTTDVYNQTRGYGWQTSSGLDDRMRGLIDPLLKDFHFSLIDNTFNVDLSNGSYKVILQFGDSGWHHDAIDVSAEGSLKIDNLSVPQGTYTSREFNVNVSDGQLNLKFHDDGSVITAWIINAIVIQAI